MRARLSELGVRATVLVADSTCATVVDEVRLERAVSQDCAQEWSGARDCRPAGRDPGSAHASPGAPPGPFASDGSPGRNSAEADTRTSAALLPRSHRSTGAAYRSTAIVAERCTASACATPRAAIRPARPAHDSADIPAQASAAGSAHRRLGECRLLGVLPGVLRLGYGPRSGPKGDRRLGLVPPRPRGLTSLISQRQKVGSPPTRGRSSAPRETTERLTSRSCDARQLGSHPTERLPRNDEPPRRSTVCEARLPLRARARSKQQRSRYGRSGERPTLRRSQSSRLRDSHAHTDPQVPQFCCEAARSGRRWLLLLESTDTHCRPIREGQVLLLRRSRLPQQQPGVRSRNRDKDGMNGPYLGVAVGLMEGGRSSCEHETQRRLDVEDRTG